MNRRALLIKTILVSLIISATATSAALAQQGLPTGLGGPDLSTNIRNPMPGQNVTVTAVSYSFDINSANLTWTANGKAVAKGIGLTTVTVQAPALGKLLVVNVTAATPDGNVVSSSYTLSSGSVDMVVEPDGYVPPLYTGKIPLTYQNTVKIVAFPHLANSAGVEYDPKTLVYSWKNGDTVLQDQSGYGKQSIAIQGALIPRAYSIDVVVTNRAGDLQTEGLISVPFSQPSISFYRDDPLYGPLFNNALSGTIYIGGQQEIGVLAVPYGFNVSSSGFSSLSSTWSINNAAHPELTGHQSVTLRAPSGMSGSSNVQLTINGVQNILQQASSYFSVVFNNSTNGTRPSVTF